MTESKHSVPEPSMTEPSTFLCGVAVSVYQNSGDPNSNWAWFEKQKSASVDFKLRFSTGDTSKIDHMDHNGVTASATWRNAGPSVIIKGEKIGCSSDFWNNYKQDIKLAADLGANAFRLSLEWSRIMPQQGDIDESAIRRYHQIFDCIESHKMEANVTLHWFVHPRWFDLVGGFTKAENIKYFLDWAKLAFENFGRRSKLWVTFNEPAVAALCGWIAGNHPPGKLMHFGTAAKVLRNMLSAHAQAYKAIKAMPHADGVHVGLVHNVFWTEPKRHNPLYGHVRLAIAFANRVWGNETVMNYLKTGTFHHWLPIGRACHWEDPAGQPGCDFFGLNHYSRGVVDFFLRPSNKGPRGMSDMGYPIYPPSIYRAISYSSTLGVPIYIMENGAPYSDGNDDRRAQWINGYLGQVQKAVEDGYDVRGFMYWTLVDNFEWNFAFELCFGLYEWRPEWNEPKKRVLRQKSKPILEWYKELPDKLGKIIDANKANTKRAPGHDVQTRSELGKESAVEKEYLKSEGMDEEQIDNYVGPEDKDPVTVGVHTNEDGSKRL